MTTPRYLVLLVLLILGSAVTNATSCGDGGDGSVPNCCSDFQGECDSCDTGYGLTKNRDACVKCSAASCLSCNGDSPNTCYQVKEKPVENCSDPGDGGYCNECLDGYDLVEAKKDDRHQLWGVMTCKKCKVKNCQSCSAKSSGVCATCEYGYGPDSKGKNCVKCAVANCNECAEDYRACRGCAFGTSKKPYYGLIIKGKGKKKKYQCVPCPKGCMFCNGDGKCHDDTDK